MFGSAMNSHDRERTLLLVGRAGDGKSATGNTILGKKPFRSMHCSSGVTTACQLQSTQLEDGNILNVIDTPDVALLMFPPAGGQVTSYSSRESVEDIMLRVMNRRGFLNPNEQPLMQSLKQSKHEGQMVAKIAIVEAHEEKLNKLNQTLSEAQQKIRCYALQAENISSVQEADAYQQFLMSVIEQIQ